MQALKRAELTLMQNNVSRGLFVIMHGVWTMRVGAETVLKCRLYNKRGNEQIYKDRVGTGRMGDDAERSVALKCA